jgi:hypothetical protein
VFVDLCSAIVFVDAVRRSGPSPDASRMRGARGPQQGRWS